MYTPVRKRCWFKCLDLCHSCGRLGLSFWFLVSIQPILCWKNFTREAPPSPPPPHRVFYFLCLHCPSFQITIIKNFRHEYTWFLWVLKLLYNSPISEYNHSFYYFSIRKWLKCKYLGIYSTILNLLAFLIISKWIKLKSKNVVICAIKNVKADHFHSVLFIIYLLVSILFRPLSSWGISISLGLNLAVSFNFVCIYI